MDVSIITSGHDVADARLHREVAALRRLGLEVEVLALGDSSDAPPEVQVRTWDRRPFLLRALHALRLPWLAKGRVVIALDPDSISALWLRRKLNFLPRLRSLRAVADVHEDYRALLRDRSWAQRQPVRFLAGLVARLGEFTAVNLDLTVVADEHLLPDTSAAESIAAESRVGKEQKLVVRNIPDLQMLPAPQPRSIKPRAIYVGDVRASRGLYRMLEVVTLAPEWELDIVGPLSNSDQRLVTRILEEQDLHLRVRIHGRRPPAQAWELAVGAWAGFLLLEDTPAFREAMPSKVFEYLAMGLPLVTSELPRPAALVRESAAGWVIATVEEAAQILNDWAANPLRYDEQATNALRAGQKLAAEFNDLEVFAREVSQL